MKPCIYIDSGFFEFLSDKLNQGPLDDVFDGVYKTRKFVFHPDVNVVFEYDKETRNQMVNDFIRVKGGRIMEGKDAVAFEVKDTPDFQDEVSKIGSKSPFSICFTGNVNPNLKHSVEKAGYYFVDADSICDFFSMPFLFNKNVFGVNKSGDICSWKDLRKLSHNFNSLVILDRFLFSKNNRATHSKYWETVSEIISNLAFRNNSAVIDVLLVSVKNSSGDVGFSLKEIREAIEQELKKKKIDQRINISIARCKQITDNNHDRMIFTNFCAMFSGNSFNYFENRTLKTKAPAINTTLNVYSILDMENWESYYRMLRSRKKELPTKDDANIPNEDLQEGNINVEFLKLL